MSDLDKDLTDFKAQINTNPMALLTAKPFAPEAKDFTAYGFKQCPTQCPDSSAGRSSAI